VATYAFLAINGLTITVDPLETFAFIDGLLAYAAEWNRKAA